MRVPVAFIVFNRPDTTERVFAEIAKAKPPKLLIIADGPRTEKTGDAENCAAVRAIVERVDWKCEVFKNYSEINLGCKRRVSTGIGWLFEQVEEAIILEDDCLPDLTFFPFCEGLLEKFRNDERVMHISGCNSRSSRRWTSHSYRFSQYTNIWGWASWRRAWLHYDAEMRSWPALRETNWLDQKLRDPAVTEYRRKTFDQVYTNEVDTWDAQWFFTCLARNGLAVTPNVNLISNIGFGEDATHTKRVDHLSNLQARRMTFPLRHPSVVKVDHVADNLYGQLHSSKSYRGASSFYSRARRKILSLLHSLRVKLSIVR